LGGGVDCFYLAQYTKQWQAIMNTVLKDQCPETQGY